MVGSDTPEDFLMEHLIVGMAEFYSRNLFREIMKGLKQRAANGHLVFRPPYGYKREIVERQQSHKRTRTISRAATDENTAPMVQRVFSCTPGLGLQIHCDEAQERRIQDQQGPTFPSDLYLTDAAEPGLHRDFGL